MAFPEIEVWVSGVPKGQPRGRAFVTGGKTRIFTPGTAEAWKGDIARAFEAHMPDRPISEPVKLNVDFYFKRPKRLMRKKDHPGPVPCASLPDWDNAGKAVCDALVHLGVLSDDKLICFASIRKWYTAKAGRTGAYIRILQTRYLTVWHPEREHE